MMPAVETADVERAFAAAGKPADTAASLRDKAMQTLVADTPNALKTAVAVSAAVALHAGTAAYKHPEVAAAAAAAAGEDDDAANEVAAISNLPAVVAEVPYAAAEAAEWAPDPISSQGCFRSQGSFRSVVTKFTRSGDFNRCC